MTTEQERLIELEFNWRSTLTAKGHTFKLDTSGCMDVFVHAKGLAHYGPGCVTCKEDWCITCDKVEDVKQCIGEEGMKAKVHELQMETLQRLLAQHMPDMNALIYLPDTRECLQCNYTHVGYPQVVDLDCIAVPEGTDLEAARHSQHMLNLNRCPNCETPLVKATYKRAYEQAVESIKVMMRQAH